MSTAIDKLQHAVNGTLAILNDPEDRVVFGNDVKGVDKTVKQIAWKAKKLDKSQQRNAAVSVYGPRHVVTYQSQCSYFKRSGVQPIFIIFTKCLELYGYVSFFISALVVISSLNCHSFKECIIR